MADLVIKPAPSTGNKLILQTQNETAVLTTSDAGVDSATSIVATKTGTETLTNKTLTAPTVADMSNFTFPAGHVIQTVVNSYSTATNITGTSAGSGTSTGLTATITPKSSSNKFLINYVGALIMDTAAAPAVSIEIHDGTSVVAYDPQWGWQMNSDGNEVDNKYKYPFMAYITPSSSGAITYTVRAWKLQPQAVTFQVDSTVSIISIQEIQQ